MASLLLRHRRLWICLETWRINLPGDDCGERGSPVRRYLVRPHCHLEQQRNGRDYPQQRLHPHERSRDLVCGPGGTIDALFTSGQTERATVVGRVVTLDLAVVKVEASKPLPTIALGHSDAEVSIDYVRDGKSSTTTLTLAAQP